ncbi:hypothetical protein [Ferruginibacter sp.]|nr:hypothetical protein [Ferruginibacter sp.]
MKKNQFVNTLAFITMAIGFLSCNNTAAEKNVATDTTQLKDSTTAKTATTIAAIQTTSIDTVLYNQKLKELANGDTSGLWPQKFAYPLPGAILPYNRIVAFYGNLYSTRMGILGEIPKDSMFKKLQYEMDKWKVADPSTPVIPALHYIAMTAQSLPGKDGKHRLRMPFHQIDTIMNWAKEINAIVFLDIQVGGSTIKEEIPLMEKYLKLPNVHFGIDPEFSLKNGETPGTKIGSFNADDINDAVDYLAEVVRKNNLPPKILMVHRFTQGMVTGYDKIKKTPEVQIVMDMDGWGDKILKNSTYLRYIRKEPVMFTGFKLFYKNDTRKDPNGMFTPEELLKLIPRPSYIQFQ